MKKYDSFQAIEKALEKLVPGQEMAAYDFLESSVCIIVDEPVRAVIVEGIRARRKWRMIKAEYNGLRENEIPARDAIETLAEKHHYSTKTIESIIYER